MSNNNTNEFLLPQYIYDKNKQNSKETYYHLYSRDSSHSYVFTPTQESVSYVIKKINKTDLIVNIGLKFIKIAYKNPKLLKLIPNINLVELSIKSKFKFDVAILSHRCVLISLHKKKVWKFPTNENNNYTKKKLSDVNIPSKVNVPEIYVNNTNESEYIVEEYITGSVLNSIRKQKNLFLSAFENLSHLHIDNLQKFETTDLITEIESYNDLKPSDLQLCLMIAENLGLPEYVYKSNIHGDFHTGNIIQSKNKLYIIDWENYEFDYIIRDIYRAILIESYNTQNKGLFVNMVYGSKKEFYLIQEEIFNSSFEYTSNYENRFEGLPILYLLLELNRIPKDSKLNRFIYEILKDIQSEYLADGSYI